MSNLVLVDSSVMIEALNARGEGWAVKLLRNIGHTRIALWDVVIGEVLVGTLSEAEFDRVGRYLSQFANLATPPDVWRRAARLGFDLRRKGVTVPLIDLSVAVVAMHNEVPLVSMDKHFELIAQVCDLDHEYVDPEDGK